MKLTNITLEDLVGPEQFNLISQDEIFEDLVKCINKNLEEAIDSEEIFDSSDAKVEIFIGIDETENVVENAYSPDIIESVRATFNAKGWANIAYEFKDEDEDSYASHKFIFYFPQKDSAYSV